MPGGERYWWTWIEKPPVYWAVIFCVAMAEFVVGWLLFETVPRWARSVPDASHPVELHMKGGHSYYLSPGLGWFLNNDLWIFFWLLGMLFLIMLLHRDKIERVR